MKQIFTKFFFFIFLFVLALSADAQWTALDYHNPQRGSLYITKHGTILSMGMMRGVDVGVNCGESWISPSEVQDVEYSSAIEVGDALMMGGDYAKFARSYDDGARWDVIDYSHILTDPKELQAAVYALCYYKDRLFMGRYGTGVYYSDDLGSTWTATDRVSLQLPGNQGGGEFVFHLMEFKGRLYNIGSSGIWRLNEDSLDLTWECVFRPQDMQGIDGRFPWLYTAVEVDGMMMIVNGDQFSKTILKTYDGENYEKLEYGGDLTTANIRGLYYDGQYIYAATSYDDAGTTKGVFVSDDAGTTWTRVSEGLTNATYMKFDVWEGNIYTCGFEDGKIYWMPLLNHTSVDNHDAEGYVDIIVMGSSFRVVSEIQGIEVVVYDLMGRVVYRNTDNVLHDLSGLNAGLYVAAVVEGGIIKAKEKIMVR